MRTIKFRGKLIDAGDTEWLVGSLVKWDNHVSIIPEDISMELSFEDVLSQCEVDPASVGQFTGSLDKNGREIYEGDIVKWHENYPPKVVNWFLCQFDAGNGESSMPLLDLKDKYILEVIGSIHDNPELLKTE